MDNVTMHQKLKDLFEGASAYIYMSLDGISISSDDPIVGEKTATLFLKHEIDNTSNKREYPQAGDRLQNYHVNLESGKYYTTPSHWVVWKVEMFHSHSKETQAMKEVVIAWCKKEQEL
jgi:hypothetical protein